MGKHVWELEWKEGKKYKEELTGQVWTVEDKSDDELYNEDGETLFDYFNLKTIMFMTFQEVPQTTLDERIIQFLSELAEESMKFAAYSEENGKSTSLIKHYKDRCIQAWNLVYELERKGE